MAKTTEAPKTGREFVRDVLKKHGVKDLSALDQAPPEVGTLLQRSESPAEWVGPLADELRGEGEFARAGLNPKTGGVNHRAVRALESKGYVRIDDLELAHMRGAKSGVTFFRANEDAEPYRRARYEREHKKRTGSYSDKAIVEQVAGHSDAHVERVQRTSHTPVQVRRDNAQGAR